MGWENVPIFMFLKVWENESHTQVVFPTLSIKTYEGLNFGDKNANSKLNPN
jgi:hypothetical protein